MMDVLQAAAVVTLWRSGRFDTLDIARALSGGLSADMSGGGAS